MIGMRSIKSIIRGKKITAASRIVLIVVFLQALGIASGRTQEIPEAPIQEELMRQERIYESRDSVPRGYVTDRGLAAYAQLLPTGFCDALGRLRTSDRWLDVGAGSGQAILDYYAPKDDDAGARKC